jgi:glycosyl transferase family 25
MVRFFDFIDKIIYINLDTRPDRDEEIRQEFKRLDIPSDKIMRFSAFSTSAGGAVGCSLSHIQALTIAKKNNWKNCLILEDDFNFIDDTEFIDKIIEHFFTNFHEWDVLNLGRGYYQDFSTTNSKYIQKVNDVSVAAAYIVNGNFYDTLLKNFYEGCEHLLKEPHKDKLYCVDRYWNKLQKVSNWYITNPSIGYQRRGMSNILNTVCDNIQFDKTIIFGKINFSI